MALLAALQVRPVLALVLKREGVGTLSPKEGGRPGPPAGRREARFSTTRWRRSAAGRETVRLRPPRFCARSLRFIVKSRPLPTRRTAGVPSSGCGFLSPTCTMVLL